MTFDPSIESKREQNLEMFNRCKIYGFDALIVKCADIYDNIDYFVPTEGYEELAGILLEKYRLFLSTAQDAPHNEPLFDALKEKVMHAELQMREFTSGS